MDAPVKMQGYINFPRQKLSDAEKTDDWYKKNLDFAENLLVSGTNLRSSFKNKKTNYNLRANTINVKDFQRYINPDNLDLETMPASFQHVGIENSKINLLLGEYAKRRKDYRAYLSSNDKDGIGRKEEALMDQIRKEVTSIIKSDSISEEEIQKRLQQLNHYQTYDYQDISEIVANKILTKEYKEGDFDFTFLKTFEDLLVGGEQIMYCGVLGRNPIMRRVNTMNFFTLGGNNGEDSDINVEYGYQSIGKIIDDYWDELTEDDIDFLENGKTNASVGTSGGIGLNRDISIYDYYGEQNALNILTPNEMGIRTFAGAFDTFGNVRVMKVCWRSRRKIGELTFFDDEGQEQKDYVPETYKVNKDLGETIKWIWVNEWLEGTKIGDHIYTAMRPNPFSSKSLTNKSKGTSPYTVSTTATNDYKCQSMTDIAKPLSYSFDIAYYKRELAIATYKGSFAALNSSMIPSGWEPKEWMRYATINKFAWFDPSNEILKGPSQGKSAGGLMNTLTAAAVQIGDPNEIQMYTNLLFSIEDTLGKLIGVTGAREGQIENREAVGNVERQVSQTNHITEKWFTIDANFRKRTLTKFLECCKYAYKKYPQKGQYITDDMGQHIISSFDEFVSSEYDLHVSNSSDDKELFEDIRALAQPALQNGQAAFADLIAMRKSNSVQDVSRKLEDSARRIKEESQEMQKAQIAADQQKAQLEAQDKAADREFKASEAEKDRQVKRDEIQTKLEIAHLGEIGNDVRHQRDTDQVDTDDNGVGDYLDVRRTDIDENYKNNQISIAERKLEETRRSNIKKEEIAKMTKSKPST